MITDNANEEMENDLNANWGHLKLCIRRWTNLYLEAGLKKFSLLHYKRGVDDLPSTE